MSRAGLALATTPELVTSVLAATRWTFGRPTRIQIRCRPIRAKSINKRLAQERRVAMVFAIPLVVISTLTAWETPSFSAPD